MEKSNKDYEVRCIDKWYAGSMSPEIFKRLRDLPHIVFPKSSSSIKKISNLTGSKLGIWPISPKYDDSGKDLLSHDIEQKFDVWSNSYNQEELLLSCDGEGYFGFYGNIWIIIDSTIGEEILSKIFLKDVEAGTIDILEKQIESAICAIDLIKWFMVPDNADADYLLFVCSEKHRDWIEQLKKM
ncbi:hypothetical protein ACQ9LF_12335 [Anaerohalosphaeraceae bacterium U12dextr]